HRRRVTAYWGRPLNSLARSWDAGHDLRVDFALHSFPRSPVGMQSRTLLRPHQGRRSPATPTTRGSRAASVEDTAGNDAVRAPNAVSLRTTRERAAGSDWL